MSISLLPEHIHGLAPQCLLPYRAAFERARTALEPAGIDTPLRLAHFMAPVTHETGGLTLKRLIKPTARTEFALSDAHRTLVRLRFSPATSAARNRFPRCPWLCEDLDYSAARLPVVLSLRLLPRGQLVPGDYAHNPRKLANAVNGGRLGNVDPDDGYRFRGRGILQLTGKDSYARVTTSLHRQGAAPPDFAREPDAILMPAWGLRVACCVRPSFTGRPPVAIQRPMPTISPQCPA